MKIFREILEELLHVVFIPWEFIAIKFAVFESRNRILVLGLVFLLALLSAYYYSYY